jgi:tetratricopeptide (TPR) repeat protein
VFWLHASSAARFDQDLQKLARDLGIPGSDDVGVNTPQLVYNWLRDDRNGRWLLVLDNADDAAFLHDAPDVGGSNGVQQKGGARSRFEYLPACRHGSMVVTSRSNNAALELVDDGNIVMLKPMESGPALALLARKLGDRSDAVWSGRLATALECIPLALAQAAAYINAGWPMCSVEQYLYRLEKSETSKTSLLKRISKERRRDHEAVDSTILTWQVSFDHILRVRPSAANLLSLISFYDHQDIPASLLRTTVDRDATRAAEDFEMGSDPPRSDTPGLSVTEDDLEKDIITLHDYLFISIPTPSSFEMHRLVQFATRVWLESNEQYQYWAQMSIINLNWALPTSTNYEHWEQWQLLYPHARASVEISLTGSEASLHRSSVLFKAACFAADSGSGSDAQMLAETSLRVRKRELGEEDERTLRTKNVLGHSLRQMGKYRAAEKLHRQALKGRWKVLGEEHPGTLISANGLAMVLLARGDYKTAEELHRWVMDISEKALGNDHQLTLSSVFGLAEVLRHQGDFKAAEELHRRALDGSEKLLGKEHPDTLTSVAGLALVLQDQGDFKAAEELHRRALDGSEKLLGKEHPDTLKSVSSLALVLQHQGDCKAAESLLWRAIEGKVKVHGKWHPNTLADIWNLAVLSENLGRDTDAVLLYEHAAEGISAALGSEHHRTVQCVHSLRELQQRLEDSKRLDVHQ